MCEPENDLPEVWGGIECTINRVNDRYADQLDFAGLYGNPDFMDSIIELGIKAIRFPVLWERYQPRRTSKIDWSFAETSLNKLRQHHIEPILGLLHHGSGPLFTNLLQDDFPELFASYAKAVANKFRWVRKYTPINEPLTTARFSALYGLWYPHQKSEISFIKCLLNELKATVMALHEIRKINPDAKFIQTEDLGKTYSTPLLSFQADFENKRRWLTYDILCGSFDRSHPLWEYLMTLGIGVDKLEFFIDNPCPPDLIGVNHYLTSERYLDENIADFPRESVGGNDLIQYADVEAVRMPVKEQHGLELLLKEIYERYKIPIAITEVHLHCTREEQLRWLYYVYDTAVRLKKEGIAIRAVTAWALLGSFGWNKLLTGSPWEYETGAFDISAGYARPTAIALLIKHLRSRNNPVNNLLLQPGWWTLNSRYLEKGISGKDTKVISDTRPLVIIGNTGTLGRAFSRICAKRNIHHVLLGRPEADICDGVILSAMISRYEPWAIINTAGYVKIDEAETEKEACYKTNFQGAEELARVCRKRSVKMVSFSSDLVFDGGNDGPYVETDLPNPLNTYGHSKYLAEKSILSMLKDALIIRTAAFFGPWDEYSFVHRLLAELEEGREFVAADDLSVSPTYVPHLVNASLDLLIDGACGIWHLTNRGCVTWYEFAKKVVAHTNLSRQLIKPGYGLDHAARQPIISALTSIKYRHMPLLEEGLRDYFRSVPLNKAFMTKNLMNEKV